MYGIGRKRHNTPGPEVYGPGQIFYVEIISCWHPALWYADHIGRVLRVGATILPNGEPGLLLTNRYGIPHPDGYSIYVRDVRDVVVTAAHQVENNVVLARQNARTEHGRIYQHE